MGRKLYAKGEGFNPSTSIEDVEGLREELDILKGGSGGGDNTAIERRLTTAEGEIDDLQRDVAEQSEEVAAVGAKVDTLQGTDTGKSVRTIAAEETAKIVGNAPANYDTLKEIADYIASDATGAAELNNKVNKNTTDIATLQSTKASKTEAQGYATTAKNEAITAAATDAQNKANTAESNAKTYADGKVKGLADGQVATNTAAIASLQTAQSSTAATVESQGATLSTHTQQITNLDSDKLGKTEKAADSAKLGGVAAADYMQKTGGTFTGDLTAPKFIGALQGNAGSATKLATPRTIWGQSFDGTGDIEGQPTINASVILRATASAAWRILRFMQTAGNANAGEILFQAGVDINGVKIVAENGDWASRQNLVIYTSNNTASPYAPVWVAALMVKYNGNVGIGTTNPSEKLDVAGNIKASGNASANNGNFSGALTVGGNATINGTMTAITTYHSSDERLKTFEGDVEVDLEKLKALPKKYFHWTADADGKRQLGTSAQAVREVFPELVSEDSDGYLSVNYSNLSVVALAVIDKLAEQNTELERRLARIEKLLNIE